MYNFLRQAFEDVPVVTGPHGEVILNLSKRELDRIEPVPSNVSVLILDHNYIRRLENLGNVYDLQQLSVAGNKLLQMHGVANLTHLTILNLPNNGIVAIDGLLKLSRLRWLNLSGNRLKSIDQLNGNLNLKHLDLSENCITQLSDISHLRKLTTLLLHSNRIGSLKHAMKYLPRSIDILSLASNALQDLDEIQNLRLLTNLDQFSIQNNPCTNCVAREYEPFVLGLFPNLRILDGARMVRENPPSHSSVMPVDRPVSIDRDSVRSDHVRQEAGTTNSTPFVTPLSKPPPPAAATPQQQQQQQQQQQHKSTSPPPNKTVEDRYNQVMTQAPSNATSTTPTMTAAGQANHSVPGPYANELPAPVDQPAQHEVCARDDTSSAWRGTPVVETQSIASADPAGPACQGPSHTDPVSAPRPNESSEQPPDQVQQQPQQQQPEISARGDPAGNRRVTPALPPPEGRPITNKPNLIPSTHAYDDTPVASLWALTSAALDPHPCEPPGRSGSNGLAYPVLTAPATPRRISDDFVRPTSSRAGASSAHPGDQSTGSSLLMSESVYVPVASMSADPPAAPPDQTVGVARAPPGPQPVRVHQVGPDAQLRALRTTEISDGSDCTRVSQELESSRATLRSFDQLSPPEGTLHSSFSMIPMNSLLPEPPYPLSVGHPIPNSPRDPSIRPDADMRTVPAHHHLIDSVHLLNDEEEDDANDELEMTLGQQQQQRDELDEHETSGPDDLHVATVRDLRMVSSLTTGPRDTVDRQDPREHLQTDAVGERVSASPFASTDTAVAAEGLARVPGGSSNPDLRIPPAILAAMAIGGQPFRRSDRLRSLDPRKHPCADTKSKSLDSNWLRTADVDCAAGCLTENHSADYDHAASTNPDSFYHPAQSVTSSGSSTAAARPVPVRHGSLMRAPVPNQSAAAPTVRDRSRDKVAIEERPVTPGAFQRHMRPDTWSSTSSVSDAPCTACGLQSKLLRDHIVLLRTQLQAQFKATEAEARMRQLHSNAIEFLLQEVQEMKAWKESVCRNWSVTPLAATATNSWLDTTRCTIAPPQSRCSNEPGTFTAVLPTADAAFTTRECNGGGGTAGRSRSGAVSAGGDTAVWSGVGNPSVAVPTGPRVGAEPLDACFDSTTQLFSRIEPVQSHTDRPHQPRREVVKVYASDDDEEEEEDDDATEPEVHVKLNHNRSQHVRALDVRNGLNRTGLIAPTPGSLPASDDDLPSPPIGLFAEPANNSSNTGQTGAADEALVEIELVRQAAMHAMTLSSSPSDGELETPRQPVSAMPVVNPKRSALAVHETPLPEPPSDRIGCL